MTGPEVAALLEAFAEDVIHLPGVSRTKPEAFAEAKSELRGKMLAKAAELRTVRAEVVDVRTISTGDRIIGSRRVAVVSTSRRS